MPGPPVQKRVYVDVSRMYINVRDATPSCCVPVALMAVSTCKRNCLKQRVSQYNLLRACTGMLYYLCIYIYSIQFHITGSSDILCMQHNYSNFMGSPLTCISSIHTVYIISGKTG